MRLEQRRELTRAEAKYFGSLYSRKRKTRHIISLSVISFLLLLDLILILLPLLFGAEKVLLYVGGGVVTPLLLLLVWDYRCFLRTLSGNLNFFVASVEGTLRIDLRKENFGGHKSIEVPYYYLDDLSIELPDHWQTMGYLEEGRRYRAECVMVCNMEGVRDNPRGGLQAETLTINQAYLVKVDGGLNLDSELRSGIDGLKKKDLVFPFAGALLFTLFFLVNLGMYSGDEQYGPGQLRRYLESGRTTADRVFGAGEIPFGELKLYNQLNLREALVLNVVEEGRGKTKLMPDGAAFRRDFQALAERAERLEYSIVPWSLSSAYYRRLWDSFPDLEDNPPYLALREEYGALTERHRDLLSRIIPYDNRPLPRFLTEETDRILERYYDDIVALERERLAEDFRSLLREGEEPALYLVDDERMRRAEPFALLPEEEIDFEGKELSERFARLSEILEDAGSRDVQGVVYKVERDEDRPETVKRIVLNVDPRRQYDRQELYKQALLMGLLSLLSLISLSVLILRYRTVSRFQRRLDTHYKALGVMVPGGE